MSKADFLFGVYIGVIITVAYLGMRKRFHEIMDALEAAGVKDSDG